MRACSDAQWSRSAASRSGGSSDCGQPPSGARASICPHAAPGCGSRPACRPSADVGRQVVDVEIEVIHPASRINPFGQLGRIGDGDSRGPVTFARDRRGPLRATFRPTPEERQQAMSIARPVDPIYIRPDLYLARQCHWQGSVSENLPRPPSPAGGVSRPPAHSVTSPAAKKARTSAVR